MLDNIDFDNVDLDRHSVSYKDRLSYRTTLQLLCNRCLLSTSLLELEINVEAFETALYFEVKGLPFKTEINQFNDGLDDLIDNFIDKQITEIRIIRDHPFYKPYHWDDLTFEDTSILRKKCRKFRSHKKLVFLINLLSRYEALMSAKDLLEKGLRDTSIEPQDNEDKITAIKQLMKLL